MDFLHDVFLGLLMFFIAVVVYDWGRIWWHARHHGYIKVGADYNDPAYRWQGAYLGYKAWTWAVLLLAWGVAVWHVVIGVCWFIELWFAVTVS